MRWHCLVLMLLWQLHASIHLSLLIVIIDYVLTIIDYSVCLPGRGAIVFYLCVVLLFSVVTFQLAHTTHACAACVYSPCFSHVYIPHYPRHGCRSYCYCHCRACCYSCRACSHHCEYVQVHIHIHVLVCAIVCMHVLMDVCPAIHVCMHVRADRHVCVPVF